MDLILSKNVVIVTGASKGNGLATTELLVEEGAQVVAVSRRPSAALEDLGAQVMQVDVDLTRSDAPRAVVTAAREVRSSRRRGQQRGRTARQHDAGVFGFLDRTDSDWRAMLEFNLLSWWTEPGVPPTSSPPTSVSAETR